MGLNNILGPGEIMDNILNIDELIHETQVKSVQLYLFRQQLEAQKQNNQMEIMRVEQELLKLDGQMELLNRLMSERSKHGK